MADKQINELQERAPTSVGRAVNPFQQQVATGAGTQVQAVKASTEIQAAILMAKHSPRDPVVAVDRILQSCTRQTLAEQALYEFQRGGSRITGPSIRLAEELSRQWGNMRFGISEVERENDGSRMMAYAWDLETNVFASREFHVKHWRDTKAGGYKIDDQRDIYELTANQGARRLRACILELIPGDVVEQAVNQCLLTQQSGQKGSTEEQRDALVKAFAEVGVTVTMIQRRVQKKLEAISQAEIPQLRRIYASIRDGMSDVNQWFEVDDAPATTPAAPPKPKADAPSPPPATTNPQTAKQPVKDSAGQVFDVFVHKAYASGKPQYDDDGRFIPLKAAPPDDPPFNDELPEDESREGDDAPGGEPAEEAPTDATGAVWDPDIHATDSEEGGPVYNKDGTFRKRRGAASQQEKPPQPSQEPAGDAPGDTGATPATETPQQQEPQEPKPQPPKSLDFNSWARAVDGCESIEDYEQMRSQIDQLPEPMRDMARQVIDQRSAALQQDDPE